jgi:hypothetical protein
MFISWLSVVRSLVKEMTEETELRRLPRSAIAGDDGQAIADRYKTAGRTI